MEFYLRNLLQSKNDTEYDGVEMFRKIVSLCQVGSSVSLDHVRKGYYLMWLNDYCYTGWGYQGKEIVKAYILTETLPTSILHPFENYKWVVVCNERGNVSHHELVLPTDENDLATVEAYTRFFLSHGSLSLKFYENIIKQSTVALQERLSTYKGYKIESWVDVMNSYLQLLKMAEFAATMVKRGTSSYGCMQRSNNNEKLVLRAKAKIKMALSVTWLSSLIEKDDGRLATYFIKELDRLTELEDWSNCKSLMEFIIAKFEYEDKGKVMLPEIINKETVSKFKDGIYGASAIFDQFPNFL